MFRVYRLHNRVTLVSESAGRPTSFHGVIKHNKRPKRAKLLHQDRYIQLNSTYARLPLNKRVPEIIVRTTETVNNRVSQPTYGIDLFELENVIDSCEDIQ